MWFGDSSSQSIYLLDNTFPQTGFCRAFVELKINGSVVPLPVLVSLVCTFMCAQTRRKVLHKEVGPSYKLIGPSIPCTQAKGWKNNVMIVYHRHESFSLA